MHTYKEVSAPAVEPITLQELKEHLHIEQGYTVEDSYLNSIITASRKSCENYCKRAFINTDYILYLDYFKSDCIEVKYPVSAVSSFTYIDINNQQQTLLEGTDFYVDSKSINGKIHAITGFPAVYEDSYNNIEIQFTTGYGAAAAAIPADIKHAVKILAAQFYLYREDKEVKHPRAVNLLLDNYKIIHYA